MDNSNAFPHDLQIMPANYCHRRSKGNLLWLAEHGIGGAALHECRRDASAPSILTLELDCTCSASSSLLKVTDVGVRDFSSDLIDSLAATSIFYQNINYLMPVNLYFPSRIRVDLLLSLRLTIHDFQWPTVVQLLSGCRDLEDLDIVMSVYMSYFYYFLLIPIIIQSPNKIVISRTVSDSPIYPVYKPSSSTSPTPTSLYPSLCWKAG